MREKEIYREKEKESAEEEEEITECRKPKIKIHRSKPCV